MRLPFSLHKSFKSSENFVQLAGGGSSNQVDQLQQPSPAASNSPVISRDRGLSTGSYASSIGISSTGTIPACYARGRPLSAAFAAHSPSSELQQAQIEEELDSIMDEMGLKGDQRLTMKNMPLDNKLQLIHTHKCNRERHSSSVTPTTALSEHLKILSRAGTQSLPRSRLERLRRDITYQSVQQLNTFVEEGGLKLLLIHLTQLNEKRTASRRVDELLKEREVLGCVLGMAKVSSGSGYLMGSTSNLRHILDSIGTMWMPCSIMSLRIMSYLIQLDSGSKSKSTDSILMALFRRDTTLTEGNPSTIKRPSAFVEWMQAIDSAINEEEGGGGGGGGSPASSNDSSSYQQMKQPKQNHTTSTEFMSSSLMLITGIMDALSHGNIDKRVKFYERLNDHGMLAKLQKLRAWGASIINSHLNRWDEAIRRDYNIVRSQRTDAIVLGGSDSTIRDRSLFQKFIAHYEAAKNSSRNQQSHGRNGSSSGNSDNDDEYLKMNLSTYSDNAGASAPATPSNNPFHGAAAKDNRNGNSEGEPSVPFFAHSRSHSSNVAETGSLKDLRSPGKPAAAAVVVQNTDSTAIHDLKSVHSLLKRAFVEVPRLPEEHNAEAFQELEAIVKLAQSMLATAVVQD